MKMPERALVGIDVGTSAVKACIWRADGFYRASKRLVGVTGPHSEQDPEGIWAAVVECLRQVLCGQDAATVAGVGLSGHGPSLMAVNGHGEPLCNIITWLDGRPLKNDAVRSEYERLCPGREASGPCYEATALWIRHQLEGASQCKLLQPKDYIGLKLTADACIDSSAFSCGAWSYDPAAAEHWIVKLLPQVVNPWEPLGVVTQSASECTGLPCGIPVAAGGIDAFVEALGAGIIEQGIACDSTGTSTCISLVVEDDSNLPAVDHVAPQMKLAVIPVSYSGGSLAWAMSVLVPEAGGVGADWTQTLSSVVSNTRLGADGLVFIPHLMGQRSPKCNPHATGAFAGLRPGHTRFDMIRAVIEGCAYTMKECVDALMPHHDLTEFRAVGSGARHDAWLQIKADVLGVPVIRMGIQEGALVGAVILAGVAGGVFADVRSGVDAAVRPAERFEPNGASEGAYRKSYAAFRRAEDALGFELDGGNAT